MILSIIIPTRGRTRGLRKCVESIRHSTGKSKDVQVIVKADDDDQDTKWELRIFRDIYDEVVYSPRGKGYDDMGRFFDEAYERATGKWVLMMDDDTTLEGEKSWLWRLNNTPTDRNVLQPEIYHLNNSLYGSGSCGPSAMIIPRDCWKKEGEPKMGIPVDGWLHELLVRKKKYKVNLIPGLIYRHKRKEP